MGAEMLDEMLENTGNEVSAVMEFKAPKSLEANNPWQVPAMLDDATGEPLTQRPDDTAQVLVKRIEEYHAQTEPILKRYRGKNYTINANQARQKVGADIDRILVEKILPQEN